jgi:hypothetical protein
VDFNKKRMYEEAWIWMTRYHLLKWILIIQLQKFCCIFSPFRFVLRDICLHHQRYFCSLLFSLICLKIAIKNISYLKLTTVVFIYRMNMGRKAS